MTIKKIAILSSGGDAPGMNACIRACVRAAINFGHDAIGIYRGYDGLIEADFKTMYNNSVSNIIQRGGTILGSARSKGFMTVEGRKIAYNNLIKNDIQHLVVIGGDGTFTGAHIFGQEYPDINIIGAPGTIDNDIFGTDFTIGYDTAINTAMEAIDKIKDTASSHDRVFIIEVMGRHSGSIALRTGLAVGAENVLIPEIKTDIDAVALRIKNRNKTKKSSSIIVIAEGDETGGANALSKELSKRIPALDARVTILGHIQRGGSPTCMERVRATEIGFGCIDALRSGERDKMVGMINQKIALTEFEKAINIEHKVDKTINYLVDILS